MTDEGGRMKENNSFHVAGEYQPLMRKAGLDAEGVFTHDRIVAWRKLAGRENCTLDAEFEGQPLRLHIKRYLVRSAAAEEEVKGVELLREAGIATVRLVG